jgi:polysaccharide biosynthesis/export protein
MLGTMILSSVVLVALSVQTPPPPAVATSPTYRIGVGDVLAIQVWEENDLTGQYTVEGDGTVAFPLVGRVPAADLAVHDFEASLQTRLADGYLRRPLVRVQVAEYRSRRVFVMGEVARPGPISLTGELSLLEALSQAGSLGERAGGQVFVLRPRQASGPGQPAVPGQPDIDEVVRLGVADLQAGRLPANVQLEHGDTIFVPRGEQIFVLGQVNTPGSYTFRLGMTVFEALALAGGPTDVAATGRIRVVRLVDGVRQELRVKPTDPVQPGDTITVPTRWF